MKNMLSDLIITKVFSATTIYTEKNAHGVKKNRQRWAVLIKYEGETLYTQGKRQIVSNINNMVILPKGSDYQWKCTKSGHFCIIEFDSDICSTEIYSFTIKNGDKILREFKSLEKLRITRSEFFEMRSLNQTYSIILKLLNSQNENYFPSSKEHKLLPAIEYIARNYNSSINNQQLAKLTGLSTVYFRKLFTQIYGTSPINYIKEIRMKKACEMLGSDYGKISDIAISLGYSNIYDFSRDFKKHLGVPPSQYTNQ